MVNVFFIVVIVIVIGLLGGLLYLIYLPFKSRLKKSGKLTDKLNLQINWTSKFYNANVHPDSVLNDSLFVTVDNEKAIWCKSEKGYRFSRQDGLTYYNNIKLDKTTNTLKYKECAD